MKSKQMKRNETNRVQRPRGRPKTVADAEQRDTVIQVAGELFLKRGYGRTMMSEVAAQAGMSLSTIYRLFPSKTDLFAALVCQHRRSMLALPGDYDAYSLVDALMMIFQIEIDHEADQERHALMSMFIAESQRRPELAPILFEQGPLQAHGLLAEWLEHQANLKRVRFSDSSVLSRMLMDIVFGAAALKDDKVPNWPGNSDRANYLRACFTIVTEGLKPRNLRIS
ncbi:TetR/AcrR family transcriptional regulator [Pararhizobium arenae]|uniref:TetR/AcrR family transcriptional regulator n=1 Tax=Pararhizobium arenae TaxID=1856850 RepID=UPI00094AD748|nr:TetR/AcrR family transcriptional regulator [Pararhizobium arenae]